MNSLTVAIPVLNEEGTVLEVIEKVRANPLVTEIIVINDGSTDGTAEVLKNAKNVKVLTNEVNRGKGFSIRRAIEEAKGEYFLVQDADLELSPDSYQLLVERMDTTKADLVMGDRIIEGSSVSIFTKLAKWFTATTIWLFYGVPISDPMTCYKLAKTERYRELKLTSDRFDIETEVVSKALRKNFKIEQVPIVFTPRSYEEGKKIKWIEGFKILWKIVKARFVNN